jgi:hypothetical protein
MLTTEKFNVSNFSDSLSFAYTRANCSLVLTELGLLGGSFPALRHFSLVVAIPAS